MLLKVENEKDLVRDSRNNAILNIDKESLARHRSFRRLRKSKDVEINNLESQVNSMSEEINKIKNILKSLGIDL